MNTALLRPFDLEAAKRGDLLLTDYFDGARRSMFTAGPNAQGEHIFDIEGHGFVVVGGRCRATLSNFYMAPICWVEDRPVYKGDTLYQNYPSLVAPRIVASGNEDRIVDTNGNWNGLRHFNWNKQQVKSTLTADDAERIVVEGRLSRAESRPNKYSAGTVENVLHCQAWLVEDLQLALIKEMSKNADR